ncbi:MAG: thioredoxin-dependent thiol peroxidase [Victivallales bacterium]|nr:thioredoxin-dependent thiol peroxidase [Victivallales bacterium]
MTQLHAGSKAPDFTLLNQDGKYVRLADFVGRKVLLYFYPRAMTWGCTVQACAVRDAFSRLRELNVAAIGISPDAPARLRKFADRDGLPFTLLSDEEYQTSESYGVWTQKSMFGKSFLGIVRSSFLIDEAGIIVACWYKVRPNATVELALEKIEK